MASAEPAAAVAGMSGRSKWSEHDPPAAHQNKSQGAPVAAVEDDADAPAAPGALSLEQIYAKIMKNKVSWGPQP